MKKMKPETAGTTIMGSRKKTVTRLRPRKFFKSSSASPKPRTNSTATQTTVMRMVRHIAAQKSCDVNASQ
jgi:hypothetical protein